MIDDAMEWTDQARCRGTDPDQFFVRGSAQARQAIKVCSRCTVRDACLQYAIDNEVDFGVWGGLTERQRRAHQRRMVVARAG